MDDAILSTTDREASLIRWRWSRELKAAPLLLMTEQEKASKLSFSICALASSPLNNSNGCIHLNKA